MSFTTSRRCPLITPPPREGMETLGEGLLGVAGGLITPPPREGMETVVEKLFVVTIDELITPPPREGMETYFKMRSGSSFAL
ncbi:MAG: hypothetical protein LBR73_02920, partial [Oscillospiraceae bacterium]|nr:hypothetical protein [Oscillospiraceae bacterium]